VRIEWSAWAVEDRDEVFRHIEADSPKTAASVDSRIESQVELLGRFPELGRPGRIENTRELVVPRTPFILAYRVEENSVLILRILRGAREWPKKLSGEKPQD